MYVVIHFSCGQNPKQTIMYSETTTRKDFIFVFLITLLSLLMPTMFPVGQFHVGSDMYTWGVGLVPSSHVSQASQGLDIWWRSRMLIVIPRCVA